MTAEEIAAGMTPEHRSHLLRLAIEAVIPRPILKALYSPDGHGGFSSATANKLIDAGLCDGHWQWTEKGNALREAVGIFLEGTSHAD